jgi:hypothetical protein
MLAKYCGHEFHFTMALKWLSLRVFLVESCHGAMVWVCSAPKAHVLKAWSLAWCCCEVVEPLEGGFYWKILGHEGYAFKEDSGTPVSLSFSLLSKAIRRTGFLCHTLLPWLATTGPKGMGLPDHGLEPPKLWVKTNLSSEVDYFKYFVTVIESWLSHIVWMCSLKVHVLKTYSPNSYVNGICREGFWLGDS